MSVPRLRFGGFKDQWIEKKIGDIAPKVGSGSTPRGGEEVYQTTGVPFIRSQNVNDDCLLLDVITYIPDEVHSRMKGSVVKPNDILLNITGASIGRSCVVPTDFPTGNVNQHVCIIRVGKGFDPRFLQPYLSSSRGQKSILSTQVGSGREGLNFQAIRSFKVFIPTLAEQTRIASSLTTVDEKIFQLSQKCDLLTQYKKGVMQQIFSQVIKFKDEDGKGFPDWKELRLGDVGEIITGKTPSTADGSLWNGDIQFVTPTDITDQKYQHEAQRKVAFNSKLKILPTHSIMFTCIASIGKMSLSVWPCITNQQINALVPKGGFNNEYIYYALLNITDFIKSTQANTTLPIINKTEFSKFVILVPTLAEQTKIANFLTAIDDKISNVQSQLTAAKQYKQGLLQQMFV